MGLFDRFKKSGPGAGGSGQGPDLTPWIDGLRDPDEQVRRRAAEALGELGAQAEAAVPALEEAISDENGEVCLAASSALARIRAAAH